MAVVVIAGAKFTVTFGTQEVTVQVKDGTISRAVNVINEKTLGPNTTPVATDFEDTVTINALYDGGDTGWYHAVWEASETLTALTVKISDTTHEWTGSLMPSQLDADFGAEASAGGSCSFTGRLARAVKP